MNIDELAARRLCFLPGNPVLLADGQYWILPGPSKVLEEDPMGETYRALLETIAHPEDRREGLLAHLCLAIYLLNFNYELESSQINGLLVNPPESSDPNYLETLFRAIAEEHLRARHERISGVVPKILDGRRSH